GLDDAPRVEPVRGAEEKCAEQECAEKRPECRVPPEESDCDAEEADLAEREVALRPLVEVAQHVDRAREARERAGDRHRTDDVLLHADAAVGGCVWTEA